MALPNAGDWYSRNQRNQWINAQMAQSNAQPYIVTTGTTNVFYGADTQPQAAPPPSRERSPLEWLQDEVEEMCVLGRGAA